MYMKIEGFVKKNVIQFDRGIHLTVMYMKIEGFVKKNVIQFYRGIHLTVMYSKIEGFVKKNVIQFDRGIHLTVMYMKIEGFVKKNVIQFDRGQSAPHLSGNVAECVLVMLYFIQNVMMTPPDLSSVQYVDMKVLFVGPRLWLSLKA
jgi:hypothetical protein